MSLRDDLVLLQRPYVAGGYPLAWKATEPVADFTASVRPAFRVECHCRNCSWKGEARFPVGTKVPLWLPCPMCETEELSAHGEFLGRDGESLEDEEARIDRELESVRRSSRSHRRGLAS